MTVNVLEQIELAKKNAAALVETKPVVAYEPLPSVLSLDDPSSSPMADTYMEVEATGLTIGQNADPVKSVEVVVDLVATQWTKAIRFGNPATYYKTYDGIHAVGNFAGSWAEAIAAAQRVDPKCRSYDSVDIIFSLVEELNGVGPDKLIGYSTSITGYGQWDAFYKGQVVPAGYQAWKVRARLGVKRMSKPGAKDWGVVTFELLGLAEDGEGA